ncbi:family 43 glycosylhydrolase [Ochrovirga pacifica]|uniref:family 43 glycosylhydrolase n=1 Tax=Ochrovirga pacifica TaxID=1042376 RepID=UPI000255A266|nr:family 43 glycosylhydrolase [Ochrovirga pacifica]
MNLRRIIWLVIGVFFVTKQSTAQDNFNFSELLPEKFDKSNIIKEKEYNVWGTNILRGKDGKFHAIYSRWPKSKGHHGWVTHSEIAHAVSDKLTGPYQFKNVVLPARGKNYWDGDCTHNPHVLEYKGKYYLYHMGNKGSGYWDTTAKNNMPSTKNKEWWINRNNQRIGVAVTDDLNGEWKRFDKPLIDATNGRMMTSTPTISKRNDGKFLLAYKYVKPHPKFKHGKVVHVTAISKSPLGPFVDTGMPFITHPTASFAIDDHVEWVFNGNYYCLAKDSRGAWSEYPDGSTMLFEGDDMGFNWKPAKNFLVIKAGEIKWTDGAVTKTTRTADMPKFYMENGIPKALIIAVLPKGSGNSYSLVIPLKTPKPGTEAFPYQVTKYAKEYPLSKALKRSFYQYPSHVNAENELYSQFKYTKLTGFDYNNGDGTITRRDPSKILRENGKYYVWYTKRDTKVAPVGSSNAHLATDEIPSVDWDLAEIWYATSKDGFHWEEQGVAVGRPEKPTPGWRAVATPDILKFKDKYYIYYQAFTEASGKRGDYCPVGVAYADNINGPWKHVNKVVVPTGAKGEWDQFSIQAPTPLVHNGKIYLYYKAAFNRPGTVWSGIGLAIAENPLGPFVKHPLNPVQNSGHEICFFPWKEGVASLTIRDGSEHFTIQYAKDWVNFEVMAITEFMPVGPNAYIPDAFLDNKNGRGITWGIGHFINFKSKNNNKWHSELCRFDCDLSLDVDDPEMKHHNYRLDPEFYFQLGLTKKQKERIQTENQTK